ncbi:Xaa-Pro aminopeptidase [Phytophthora megakarya]|uniref:Xaa-Pro aminopeptidase n=1 Tax=Phytophthora megakarya TaxID=4795 RepID=A0A225VL19_9STRA|nr:Xaa-Pro aminopeptidase [Phytophthora megakarya]
MSPNTFKSVVEIEGMRQAHLRDGATLVKYFGWLEKEMEAGQEDQWDEIHQQVKDYVSLRFDTISSIGANGSILQYSPNRGECAKISTAVIYLNDSGAQYLNGTMDIN